MCVCIPKPLALQLYEVGGHCFSMSLNSVQIGSYGRLDTFFYLSPLSQC